MDQKCSEMDPKFLKMIQKLIRYSERVPKCLKLKQYCPKVEGCPKTCSKIGQNVRKWVTNARKWIKTVSRTTEFSREKKRCIAVDNFLGNTQCYLLDFG